MLLVYVFLVARLGLGVDDDVLVVGLWLQRIGVDTVIIVLRLQCIASVWASGCGTGRSGRSLWQRVGSHV